MSGLLDPLLDVDERAAFTTPDGVLLDDARIVRQAIGNANGHFGSGAVGGEVDPDREAGCRASIRNSVWSKALLRVYDVYLAVLAAVSAGEPDPCAAVAEEAAWRRWRARADGSDPEAFARAAFAAAWRRTA